MLPIQFGGLEINLRNASLASFIRSPIAHLEWTNPNDVSETGWRPRVRKLAPDQALTTLITISENVPVNRRP